MSEFELGGISFRSQSVVVGCCCLPFDRERERERERERGESMSCGEGVREMFSVGVSESEGYESGGYFVKASHYGEDIVVYRVTLRFSSHRGKRCF